MIALPIILGKFLWLPLTLFDFFVDFFSFSSLLKTSWNTIFLCFFRELILNFCASFIIISLACEYFLKQILIFLIDFRVLKRFLGIFEPILTFDAGKLIIGNWFDQLKSSLINDFDPLKNDSNDLSNPSEVISSRFDRLVVESKTLRSILGSEPETDILFCFKNFC